MFEWTRTYTDPLFVYSTEPKEACKFLNGDVSGKIPTYPSPIKVNINTYFSLGRKCCHRGGVSGQFPRNVL